MRKINLRGLVKENEFLDSCQIKLTIYIVNYESNYVLFFLDMLIKIYKENILTKSA